jgi:hypothetical protein
MSLQHQRKQTHEKEVDSVEWSNTTKFLLYKTSPYHSDDKASMSLTTTRPFARWFIMCERVILETGVKEEIVISSSDTEYNARKSFRMLRRVTGYVDCDNEMAIPGLF